MLFFFICVNCFINKKKKKKESLKLNGSWPAYIFIWVRGSLEGFKRAPEGVQSCFSTVVRNTVYRLRRYNAR